MKPSKNLNQIYQTTKSEKGGFRKAQNREIRSRINKERGSMERERENLNNRQRESNRNEEINSTVVVHPTEKLGEERKTLNLLVLLIFGSDTTQREKIVLLPFLPKKKERFITFLFDIVDLRLYEILYLYF